MRLLPCTEIGLGELYWRVTLASLCLQANTSGELVDLMNDAGVFKVGADVAGDIAMLRTHVPPPAADVAHPQWDFQSLKAKGVVDLTTLFRVTEGMLSPLPALLN